MSKEYLKHSQIIIRRALLALVATLLIIPSASPGAASPSGAENASPDSQQPPGGIVEIADPGGAPLTDAVQTELQEIVGRAQQAMILLERAENIIVEKCMDEAGFQYHGPTDANVPLRISEDSIGLLRPDIAQRLGYGPYVNPPSEEANQIRDLMAAGDAYFQSLTPDEQVRYLRTLEGQGDQGAIETNSGMRVLVDGCIGEARVTLLGDRLLEVFDTFTRVQFLQTNAWAAPEVLEALQVWKDCMRESGFGYEHPNGAVGHGLELRGNSPNASQAEIDLATADADCRIQAQLTPLVEDTAARLNREVVESNQQLLTAWGEIELSVRDRAANVLAQAKGS